MRITFSPHSRQSLLVNFLMIAIPGVRLISHFGFDLHFPDEYLCLVCGPDCHVFFGKICTQVLCPFFSGLFVHFLMLTCMSSLYTLDINALPDMSFVMFSIIWYAAFSFF